VYIFRFLVFILVVVGLFCQYHSQVIGWKSLVSEMTCYVSSWTLNSTHSLTRVILMDVLRSNDKVTTHQPRQA